MEHYGDFATGRVGSGAIGDRGHDDSQPRMAADCRQVRQRAGRQVVDDDDTVDEDKKTPEEKAIEARNAEPPADDPIVREQRDGTTN